MIVILVTNVSCCSDITNMGTHILATSASRKSSGFLTDFFRTFLSTLKSYSFLP